MSDVTQILNAIEQGDQAASEKLLPLVYAELRTIIRADQVISNTVREQALDTAELFWKNRSLSRKIPTGPM